MLFLGSHQMKNVNKKMIAFPNTPHLRKNKTDQTHEVKPKVDISDISRNLIHQLLIFSKVPDTPSRWSTIGQRQAIVERLHFHCVASTASS